MYIYYYCLLKKHLAALEKETEKRKTMRDHLILINEINLIKSELKEFNLISNN